MNRRSFLANLGSASAGLAIASFGLELRSRIIAQAGSAAPLKAFGYGELFPIAAKNTGEVYLALPKGFEYNVIGKAGTIMSDGRRTPSQHDGMHAFRVGRELRLVRNHEVANRNLPVAGAGIARGSSYDETCGGGTVTLVVDPRTHTLVRDFVSLSGTHINCAGGATPWGSWISCEETTLGRTVRMLPGGLKRGGFDKPHGYCFEVPAAANEPVQPVPLKAMGRFVHERSIKIPA
jgi:secreted PhoX family phosphatase